MSRILIGQNSQAFVVSAPKPINCIAGFAIQAAKEPLIENTISIAATYQLEVKFQRFFNFSIVKLKCENTIFIKKLRVYCIKKVK